ncbi:MAG: hypothetical protein PHY47_24195 [Lachnospiraceae bacterium]|nr:hypothetical protein [Lachnospiraceae bacterium]
MLGWLLLGAILGAAVITICVTYLDKSVAKDKLKAKNIKKGVVKDIVNSSGVTHIKLDAIDEDGNEKQVEFEAQDYNSSEIRKGMTIVA